ncbi:hypothetical protein [Oenococcus phage Vinitor-27]|nr:hypothetical protein [Oenococcus phage Vinitor-27]
MSVPRKYFYLKLKDNFFDSEEIIILESMDDGYLYENILLKLYLRSLKNEGKLMFKGRIPYSVDMLAKITRHKEAIVEKAIKIFKQLGLVEILDDGAIFMSDIQNFIGNSTTEADRIRDYRRRIKNESTNDVQMYNKATPELELEKELELNINNDVANRDLQEEKKYFEEFWNLYNHKVGSKKKSFKYFHDSIKKHPKIDVLELVLQGTKRYIAYQTKKNGDTSRNYYKYPERFLRDELWNDEYDLSTIKTSGVKQKETLLDYNNLDNNGKIVSNSEAEHALERLQHGK